MMNIINIIFMYAQMVYVVLTESLFMQIFTVILFYAAARSMYAPRKNWYYPEQDNNA